MAANALLVANCPRCGHSRVTCDMLAYSISPKIPDAFEIMARCRSCWESTLFLIKQTIFSEQIANFSKGDYINRAFELLHPILIISSAESCPDHVPEDVKSLFDEGAKCMAVQCYDASGTMFRKVLDAATRQLLPDQPKDDEKSHPGFISWKTRKDLGLRLSWLFDNKRLPENLRDLAACVREDGNDAAHDITGIGKAEAADLRDFTVLILETLYTTPGQIEENKKRRAERRQGG